MVRTFEQVVVFHRLCLFRLEVIKGITQRKRNDRIIGFDTRYGVQVVLGDITHVTGRVEYIPESERTRQPAVEELLADSQVHITECIRLSLRGYGRAYEIAVELDPGIFRHIERIVERHLIIRAGFVPAA